MIPLVTADAIAPSADTDSYTVDQGVDALIRPGWPCAALGSDPPSVADRLSAPSPDDILPQVLALTPRGAAWGTDEAGDGQGASPVMRRVWRAVATWVADLNARDWTLATQAFPSAIVPDLSLAAWEAELGLPDPCISPDSGTAARINAVRARFAAQGGSSPAYFICLASALGYTIAIDEPTQFLVDVSAVGVDSIVEGWFRVDEGAVGADTLAEGWFRIDEGAVGASSVLEGWFLIDAGEIDADPLESFSLAADTTQLGQGGDPLESFSLIADTTLPGQGGDPLESFTLPADPTDLDEAGAAPIVEDDFRIDDGEIDDPVEASYPAALLESDAYSADEWKYWVVHVAGLGDTYFRVDEGAIDTDPIEGFLVASDLECLLRRYAPEHTRLVFAYGA